LPSEFTTEFLVGAEETVMKKAKRFPCTINLSVLGYREEGEWVALALEMDLRGYGDTFEDAVEDLQDHICMQISFARFKNDPDLIFKPAEPEYIRLFSTLQQDLMRARVMGKSSVESDYDICDLPMPTADVMFGCGLNGFTFIQAMDLFTL
jgi:hypothetical protein